MEENAEDQEEYAKWRATTDLREPYRCLLSSHLTFMHTCVVPAGLGCVLGVCRLLMVGHKPL